MILYIYPDISGCDHVDEP